MNRAELIKAFEMKADGYTYKRIGRRLGYEASTVAKALKEVLGQDYKLLERCRYINLRVRMRQLNWTLKDLAAECDYTYFYTMSLLNGNAKMTGKAKDRIARRLGSSVDALFAPEQETVGRG